LHEQLFSSLLHAFYNLMSWLETHIIAEVNNIFFRHLPYFLRCFLISTKASHQWKLSLTNICVLDGNLHFLITKVWANFDVASDVNGYNMIKTLWKTFSRKFCLMKVKFYACKIEGLSVNDIRYEKFVFFNEGDAENWVFWLSRKRQRFSYLKNDLFCLTDRYNSLYWR
jgi:hypothetical protein